MTTDFTSTKKSKQKNKKKRKWLRILVTIVILLILVVVVIILINYSTAKQLYQVAIDGKDYFVAAQKSIEEQNFAKATEELKQANQKFIEADELVDMLWEFKLIPYVRKQMVAVENLVIVGTQLSSAVAKVTELGDEVISMIKTDGEVSFSEITEEQKKDILEMLYQSPPDLQGVKAEIDLAAYAMEQIPQEGLLDQLAEAMEPIKENFPHIKQLIDRAIPFIQVLPQIAGYPEEKVYLFLLQNNAELRPTGGFIGTYGIIKVHNGEIKHFETDNIYNLDNPAGNYLYENPPWQYTKYMDSKQLLMRDSNWSPDFPESAEKALWFYNQEGGEEEQIDGVIAVTPEVIKDLIELVGSVTVSGIEFTPENFVETIQYEVEQAFWQKGISDSERKAIIGDIGAKLMEDLLALPKERWQDLWATFIFNVTAKQLFMYFNNVELQQTSLDQGWAGEIKQVGGDYLMIVDCNLASLKTDPGVIRTITYNLTEENGDLIADVSVHYKNEGNFNWKSTRLRTYTRLIVPEGSELIEYTGVMENDKLNGGGVGEVEITQQWDRTVFGGFISIEPNEEGTLHYKYKLPDSISKDDYSFYLQKQGGAAAHGANLNFNFDQSIKVFSGLDNLNKSDNNTITWQGSLDQDISVLIGF